jgi:16S rRNA (cytosine967-C5)-methyltransferase
MLEMKSYLALRLSPGVDSAEAIGELKIAGCTAWPSPDIPGILRTASTALPSELPGYEAGRISPTTESAAFVVETARAFYRGGPILDCCAGRGTKTSALAGLLPEVPFEAWDLSEPRVRAGERDLRRLGLAGRVTYRCGDALRLEPLVRPSLILVDVPCSGSGTWRRHPEAKWRTWPAQLDGLAATQEQLLRRACELVAPGGTVVYSTCSLFRQENEGPVAAAAASRTDLVEAPIPVKSPHIRPGRPYGRWVRPELPWIDGFYAAVLVKRG